MSPVPEKQQPNQGKMTGLRRLPRLSTTVEAATLLLFTAFFLFYGIAPFFGGAGIGLVGADEPRYAQIAHEMLVKLDSAHTLRDKLGSCVTPYLYGRPWLEKPALYYWRAMFAFKEFGVHDWSARLPSAGFAFLLVTLSFLHMRRFRRGGHLDAALITASCIGILSFARGASTDMQMAAPFCVGMLGWYAWYETDSKFWLFDIYFFVGAATLAKGPVAPFLALCILVAFAALRKEWSLLRRTIWWPGVALYFAMVLPWFIAVQRANPSFFREFFLEHNLERFATNRYQHYEPFWYYLPILLLALSPWTVIAIRALIDGAQESIKEWRRRHSKNVSCEPQQTGDAFPEFLVLWALIPVIFFSLSHSKLPGYILPSVPPITILAGDFLNRKRKTGLLRITVGLHAVLVGILLAFLLMLPWHVVHGWSWPPMQLTLMASLTGLSATLLIVLTVYRFGLRHLRLATTVPMVIAILFLFGIGPIFGFGELPDTKRTALLLDASYSARPLEEQLEQVAPIEETVSVYRVRRDVEYGLAFYRNRETVNYEHAPVPQEKHLLVVRDVRLKDGSESDADLGEYLKGRQYKYLFSYPAQNLLVFEVAPR